MNPLQASLDLHFSDSCNCFFSNDNHSVFIDEDLVAKKFSKKRHHEHIDVIYDRILIILHKEFDDTDIDNAVAVSVIEKITNIILSGAGRLDRPPKVIELRRIASAIDIIRKDLCERSSSRSS